MKQQLKEESERAKKKVEQIDRDIILFHALVKLIIQQLLFLVTILIKVNNNQASVIVNHLKFILA